jgi:hypothetical protein
MATVRHKSGRFVIQLAMAIVDGALSTTEVLRLYSGGTNSVFRPFHLPVGCSEVDAELDTEHRCILKMAVPPGRMMYWKSGWMNNALLRRSKAIGQFHDRLVIWTPPLGPINRPSWTARGPHRKFRRTYFALFLIIGPPIVPPK